MPKISFDIDQASDKWKRAFPSMKSKIEKIGTVAFQQAKKPAAFNRRHFEINVLLTDDATIKTLNNDYRDKNKPTNVLSFPQLDMQNFKKAALDMFPPDMPIPLGDIALAFDTIQREAIQENKTLENHVLHLIVHGTLHLLGYDHIRAKEAKDMEKLECDILLSLGYPDPYHIEEETKQRK